MPHQFDQRMNPFCLRSVRELFRNFLQELRVFRVGQRHGRWFVDFDGRELRYALNPASLIAIAQKRSQARLYATAGVRRWVKLIPSSAKLCKVIYANLRREELPALPHEIFQPI